MTNIAQYLDESIAFLLETIEALSNLGKNIQNKYIHIKEIREISVTEIVKTENTIKALPDKNLLTFWRDKYKEKNSKERKFIKKYIFYRFRLIKDFLFF